MGKEIGPKEQRLREFKEAKFERQQQQQLKVKRKPQIKPLKAVKRGRSR